VCIQIFFPLHRANCCLYLPQLEATRKKKIRLDEEKNATGKLREEEKRRMELGLMYAEVRFPRYNHYWHLRILFSGSRERI
jgi:hypothetical protein